MEVGASVRYRDAAGREAEAALDLVDPAVLADAAPWRVFRSHRGQAHYSGWYWSATMGGHVVYESRLELARLLIADFDPAVVAIAAQPFLVCAADGARLRRHVPDFLLLDAGGAVTVVNVKPAGRLADERVAAALNWAGTVFRSRGWSHEVWSGAPAQFLVNLRFLAGYRFADRVDRLALEFAARRAAEGPVTLAGLEADQGCDAREVRAAVLHLLWVGVLRADLFAPLSGATVLERAR